MPLVLQIHLLIHQNVCIKVFLPQRCQFTPVVDVDVDPVAVSPEPDPDHASVVRPAEHLFRRADAVQELLPLGDGRARRQQPAVAENALFIFRIQMRYVGRSLNGVLGIS